MRIFTIDGKKLALELDWNTLDGENRTKAIKQLLAEESHQGVTRGIVIENEGQVVVGLAEGDEKQIEPSAAAWLAEANRQQNEEISQTDDEKRTGLNWIVIENLGFVEGLGSSGQGGEEGFWFSVIQDSLPLPGADVVMTWDDLTRSLTRFLTQKNLYSVYSKDARIVNAFSTQANIHSKGFWELVGDVRFKKKIKPLTGLPPILVGVVVAVFVLLLVWFAYSHFQKQRALKEAQAAATAASAQAAAAAAASKAAYQQSVLKTIDITFKSGLADINSSLTDGDPTKTIMAWNTIVTQIPLSHEGWQMNGIQCDVSARVPECIVKLTRGELGINRTLVEHFPNVQLDGDDAFYVIRGPQLPDRENHVQNIVGGRTLALGLLSDLQVLRIAGIQHSVTASSQIVKAITLPKKSGPAALHKKVAKKSYNIEYGVASGTLSLSGNQLWQLKDLANLLDSPALVIKGVTLGVTAGSLDSSPWTLNFAYFVRTAPYPVIPAIPEADIAGGPIDPETGKAVIQNPNTPTQKAAPDFTPGGVQGSTISSTQQSTSPSDLSAPVQGLPSAQ